MSNKLSAKAAVALILTVVILVVSMCLGVLATQGKVSSPVYADADESYAKDELVALYESGIIVGDADGGRILLHPKSAVTRGEFVETLVRFFGISADRYTDEYITYPDYSKLSQNVKSALCALSHYSLTDGVFPLTGDFSEGKSVLRLEAALMLGKLIGGAGASFGFADADSIPTAVFAQIAGLIDKKIVIGFPDGTLGLEKELTREQLALILTRFRNYTEQSKN